jgi:hypothetical protein
VREALTKNDDFFKDATMGAAITGSGQMIYWRNCTIKVYKSGETKKALQKLEKCDGQALVRKGTSLLLEDGPVKEE